MIDLLQAAAAYESERRQRAAATVDPLADAVLRNRSASGVSLVSERVASWTSTVGGHEWTQPSAGERPGFTASRAGFNDKPTVDGGVNDYMVMNHHADLVIKPAGWFVATVVASPEMGGPAGNLYCKWVGGTPNREWITRLISSGPDLLVRNAADSATSRVTWGTDIRDGLPHIVEWYWDPTAGVIGISVDAATDATTAAATANAAEADPELFALAGSSTTDRYLADLAQLPYMPTAAHRGEIRAALADEYGVTLA